MPYYARHIRLDRHYHLFINLNNFYIMYKKILLQALALVLFAAFAMASSQDFQDGYRAGWNSTAPEEYHY